MQATSYRFSKPPLRDWPGLIHQLKREYLELIKCLALINNTILSMQMKNLIAT